MGSENADSTAVARRRRVLLCWPIFQALYPRPFQGFAEILVTAGRQLSYEFGVKVYERSLLVPAMEDLGALVLREGWDAVIVFDDDCFPPHDVIPHLLIRCFDEGHPIVAAAGVMRNYPWTTTAARSFPEGISVMVEQGTKKSLAGFEWIDDLPNELVEVDFNGFPVGIIHRRVFEQTTQPWFGDHDPIGERVTHDVFFCRKAKEVGFALKVDGTIRCGHLAEAAIITFENRASVRQAVQVAP